MINMVELKYLREGDFIHIDGYLYKVMTYANSLHYEGKYLNFEIAPDQAMPGHYKIFSRDVRIECACPGCIDTRNDFLKRACVYKRKYKRSR